MTRYEMAIKKNLTIASIKQQLSDHIKDPQISTSNLAVLFMGRELTNQQAVNACDLGDYSVLHVLNTSLSPSSHHHRRPESEHEEDVNKIKKVLTSIENNDVQQGNESLDQSKLYFFVFCQHCQQLKNGKLRVVCDSCGQASMICKRDPQNWQQILKAKQIECDCFNADCHNTGGACFAHFYFKCIDESRHQASQTDSTLSVIPLFRIRRNTINAECSICANTENSVLVFACDHVICLSCFHDYCVHTISERLFVLRKDESDIEPDEHVDLHSSVYTTKCPFNCPDSWLESEHFRLLTPHYREFYERFHHEDVVSHNKGIFCPHANCDQDYYPSSDQLNECQVHECSKCSLIYCIRCVANNQFDSVFCQNASLIRQTNAVLKLNASSNPSSDFAPSTSHEPPNILSNLIAKFTSFRTFLANGGDQSDQSIQPVRWQETMSEILIKEIAKPCPKCRTPTERDGGCMHMTCQRKRCNFEWCWVCSVQWNPQCMTTHWFG